MDIKFIKQLTDNYKIKGILDFFWDFELKNPAEGESQSLFPYRTELRQHTYKSIEEVFTAIKNLFLQSLPPEDFMGITKRRERRELESFAKKLFGDPFCWEDGTVFSERRTRSENGKQIQSERIKAAANNYPQLSFIYDLFHLTARKNKRCDFVVLLVKNQAVAEAIIREKSIRDLSKVDVYNICEKTILGQFSCETISWNQYNLMNSVSYFVFGSHNYWIEINHIDETRLKERFLLRRKDANESPKK